MKQKKLLFLLLGLTLMSCRHSPNSENVSTSPSQTSEPYVSVSIPTSTPDSTPVSKELIYDSTLPEVEKDNYTFAPKTYESFPTNLVETEGLTYELSEDGTYYIVSGRTSFYGSKLVIPAYYNNLPVKEIATDGFAYKEWLSEVYIPETIETFGSGSFSSDPRLTKVYYNAKSANDLAGRNWVFYPKSDATNLIDVYFGPAVEKIPDCLFFPLSSDPSKLSKVGNIYFAENTTLKSIGEYAFYKANEAIIHDLPDSIETIGNYAFYEGNTENLNLPTALKTIGNYAFAYNNIKHVNLSENLETIGEYAFYSCDNLTHLDLSNTKLEIISENAFRNCTSLKSVVFNNKLKTIDNRAFEGTGLEVVDLSDNVEVLGENAFANCSSLKAIKLNENLQEIKNGAFKEARAVTKLVVYAKHLKDFASSNNVFPSLGKENGVEIIFMSSVEVIPEKMFYPTANEDLDPRINRVVLLKTIQEIKSYAFFELEIAKVDYEGNESEFAQVKTYNNILNVEYFNN